MRITKQHKLLYNKAKLHSASYIYIFIH